MADPDVHFRAWRAWRKLLLYLFMMLQMLCAHAEVPLHFVSAQTLSIPSYGYTPPRFQINPADLEGAWQTVSLPHVVSPLLIPRHLRDNPHQPLTVINWYHLKIPPLPIAASPRYLYLPRLKTEGQVAIYCDGRLLYQSHTSMLWNNWNTPLWIALNDTADKTSLHAIDIRIQRLRNSEGSVSSIWLGEENELRWRYYLRYLLQVQMPFMSSAAFLAVGIFSLFVWFRQRDEWLYGLFFCLSLAAFLRNLHFYLGTERLPISDEWFSWITINSLFWEVGLVQVFMSYLHGRPHPWLNRLGAAIILFVGIITLPPLQLSHSTYSIAPLVYLLLLMIGVAFSTTGWHSARLSKSFDGLLLAGWGFLGMLFGIYDWLLMNNFVSVESIYLGPYSNIIAFVIAMTILLNRYIAAIADAKQQNQRLESQLHAQNLELQQNYRILREIEHRQILTEERQRIVQDMHDGLGSSLVSALRVVEHGQLSDADIVLVLKGCIDDLKLSIDSMEPVQADLLLLLATLRFRLGPRLESTGIKLRWEVVSVPELNWLDPRNSLHILRILQETFTNIIKHTHASEIIVKTGVDGNMVFVNICDNGQGFSIEHALQNRGKGLKNQISRAEAIQSEIRWDSTKNGTTFTLKLPISQNIMPPISGQ